MPLTVITLKNAPPGLRGDLSKWMQEIATGVYVANINSRIREKLWLRIKENIGKGETTLSYHCRNELGYNFDTFNTERFALDFDGIPLVFFPNSMENQENLKLRGFSTASKIRKWKKYSSNFSKSKSFIILDIETDGLSAEENNIIEIGAFKVVEKDIKVFSALINNESEIPRNIVKLTGITNEMLEKEGEDIRSILSELDVFIGELPIIGYGLDFDISFINNTLRRLGMEELSNKTIDLMRIVKERKKLQNYKLQTVINEYGIDKSVPHRALGDVELIYTLFLKLKKFVAL